MNYKNIEILNNTLDILKQGYYIKNDQKIYLKLSYDEMKNIEVFLPNHIQKLNEKNISSTTDSKCIITCENIDSYSMARSKLKNGRDVLVLNFASSVNPGGGVRKGSSAQEEDLCRTSSLLLSLESKEASKYYSYNRKLRSNMGSDAIMITPKVEIIKESRGTLLNDSVVVSVMTCAAPRIRYGLEGLSEVQYKEIFYNRITSMLKVAAYKGYRHLVLGAFGCGAYGNDAKVVSDLFYKALKEFYFSNKGIDELFEEIDFAVYTRKDDTYNFEQFYLNFGYYNLLF